MNVGTVSVLILSYNALPMDVVSSYRAKAYCDHFTSFGVKPTLLTHRWEMVDNRFVVHRPDDEVLTEETESCKIIRLPYPGTRPSRSNLHTILSYMNGDIDVELISSYRIFRKFLWHHLEKHRYDFIIAIYNPHFHLKLAYEIQRKFKIPCALDFRDLWENDIVTRSYNPGLKKRITNAIIAFWWRKWIRYTVFFSTVSPQWREFLTELSGKAGIVVRNGFDGIATVGDMTPAVRTSTFKVVHFGRMYHGQDLDVFLEGFRRFTANFSPMEVTFEVIGLKKAVGIDCEKKIKDALGAYVVFRPYIAKNDLINYCKEQATLFFFPDFSDDNGSLAVKVYDYLMLGKNILIAPGGGEVSRLVFDLNAGVVVNDPESVLAYLNQCYREYKRNGYLTYKLNREKLKAHSRERQVNVLANHIKRLTSKRR